MDSDSLASVRQRIDQIDSELLRLLNERATCALEVAEIKAREENTGGSAFYRPEREARIMHRLTTLNKGPLSAEHVERLFREVISCCLSLEQPLTVAYLGPKGTYTEAAALKQFGHFANMRSMTSIDEVFHEVEAQAAHFGVVPVENSTEGMVNHTLDCFIKTKLKICAEVQLRIHHALLIAKDQKEEDIEVIYSHQQSLAQCRKWLDKQFPKVERRAVSSNAEAARVASSEANAAAIAGELAADQFRLDTLYRNIEDQSDNTTRFLVIGDQTVDASGDDKSSILVSAKNEPGALLKILQPFQQHDISLSRIETRPSGGGDWSYVFFIDFDGHESSEEIGTVLEQVKQNSSAVKSLGSYPKAPL